MQAADVLSVRAVGLMMMVDGVSVVGCGTWMMQTGCGNVILMKAPR